MKIYNPREFQKLYDYKESIEDKTIKELITKLIKNYNMMYIKLKDLIKERENIKSNYKELDRLSKENEELSSKVNRYELIIDDLKKRIKEAQKT